VAMSIPALVENTANACLGNQIERVMTDQAKNLLRTAGPALGKGIA
jgi:hypothetical protein